MGKYIAFEGIDGVGKTEISKEFAKLINAYWIYEPERRTDIQKTIYDYTLSNKDIDNKTRELLLWASRNETYLHIQEKLDSGEMVVSDRSFVSGFAYGMVEGNPMQSIDKLLQFINFKYRPFVVYCCTEEQKIEAREDDRYDNKNDEFFNRLKSCFEKYFKENTHNIRYMVFNVNLNLSAKENAQLILNALIKYRLN